MQRIVINNNRVVKEKILSTCKTYSCHSNIMIWWVIMKYLLLASEINTNSGTIYFNFLYCVSNKMSFCWIDDTDVSSIGTDNLIFTPIEEVQLVQLVPGLLKVPEYCWNILFWLLILWRCIGDIVVVVVVAEIY